MRTAAFVAAFVALVAVGCSRRGDARVVFKGVTPTTRAAKETDTRSVEFACPACGTKLTTDAMRCPNRDCGASITWPDSVACGYCADEPGVCTACRLMMQLDGKCYYCKGRGTVLPSLGSKPCPNCQGQKTCPICGGSRKCDMCSGSGKVSLADLKEKARPKEEAPKEEPASEKPQ